MAKIERCIFSYFNPQGFENRGGFLSFRDQLFSMALSAIVANRHFKNTILYTNTEWADFFYELGMPHTVISNRLDDIDHVNKYFWAYGKMYAYSIQDEPFVHIDNDVYLWDGLPSHFDDYQLWFQSKEPFYDEKYGYYLPLRDIYQDMPVKPDLKLCNDYAYNCGIAGGSAIDIFKEHIQHSSDYIFAPKNQEYFFEKYKDMIIHQNLMHEQYFLSSVIKNRKMRMKTTVLHPDVWKINRKGYRYTHLWGCSKLHGRLMMKVRKHVFDHDSKLHDRLARFEIRNYELGTLSGTH